MSGYSLPSKGYKELIADAKSDDEGGKDYMRFLSRVERSRLIEGKRIQVVDCTGKLVLDFPLALFNAASTKKELVCDGKIALASDLNTKQVMRLFEMILKVPKAGAVCDFPAVENTRIDLEFHSAAEALGFGSFTQRIFDLYFKRVNSRIPSVANIEAIAAVRTPPGDKIFKQMAYNIAINYYKGKIPNRAAFESYLTTNTRLRAAVEEVVARKEAAAQRLIQHENNHAAFVERERHREERLAEQEERNKAARVALRAQQASEKVKQQERQEKEKAVRKAMLEKKRAGQKLNAEEARAHEKLFGKAVAQ